MRFYTITGTLGPRTIRRGATSAREALAIVEDLRKTGWIVPSSTEERLLSLSMNCGRMRASSPALRLLDRLSHLQLDGSGLICNTPPSEALRPAAESALREWIVSSRVNRTGHGDDDPTIVEPVAEVG